MVIFRCKFQIAVRVVIRAADFVAVEQVVQIT